MYPVVGGNRAARTKTRGIGKERTRERERDENERDRERKKEREIDREKVEEGEFQRISNSQLFTGAFDVTSARERDGLP